MMLYRDVCRVLSFYLFGFAAMLTIPLFLAGYYQFFASPELHPQPHATFAFFLSTLLTLLLAIGCFRAGKLSSGHLHRREGLISVVAIWFLTPFLAGAPYVLSGTLENPFHAYFEAASGFTTTGATTMQAKAFDPETGKEIPLKRVFCGTHTTLYRYWGTIEPVRNAQGEIVYEGVEAVSRALIFWRSFSQWLGGMGIVVLFVAILPLLGVGGKRLFHAEMPGPIKDSLTPRIKETAIQLWKIYLGLSILQVCILMVTNQKLPLFDALTITFSTMSTGGFSAINGSIGGYGSVATEWVVIAFMILASINFSLYFFLLRGKVYKLYEPEFFLFFTIILLSCTSVTWFLWEAEIFSSIGYTIRMAAFQLISAMTTTGFVTANYEQWPYSVQVIMLLLMFIGGMSGSTAGGMKVIRHYLLFRIAQYKVESLFRPETVRRFTIGDRDIDQEVSNMVLVYFVLVVAIAAFSTLFFVIEGIDPESALALVALLVNNIGIGFRMASPEESLAFLSNLDLLYASLLMIFGRLEFFAVLAMMVPAFWRESK